MLRGMLTSSKSPAHMPSTTAAHSTSFAGASRPACTRTARALGRFARAGLRGFALRASRRAGRAAGRRGGSAGGTARQDRWSTTDAAAGRTTRAASLSSQRAYGTAGTARPGYSPAAPLRQSPAPVTCAAPRAAPSRPSPSPPTPPSGRAAARAGLGPNPRRGLGEGCSGVAAGSPSGGAGFAGAGAGWVARESRTAAQAHRRRLYPTPALRHPSLQSLKGLGLGHPADKARGVPRDVSTKLQRSPWMRWLADAVQVVDLCGVALAGCVWQIGQISSRSSREGGSAHGYKAVFIVPLIVLLIKKTDLE